MRNFCKFFFLHKRTSVSLLSIKLFAVFYIFLSEAFPAISNNGGLVTCFSDARSHCDVARHVVLLNVDELAHPHTGDALADAIADCLRD